MRGILQLCPAAGFFTAYNGGSGNNGGGAGATAAWEGNTIFPDWGETKTGDDVNIYPEKLTSKTIGLKVYWSATADGGITLKMQTMNWGNNQDVKFKKSDDPSYATDCYLWATTTNTEFTIDPTDLDDFRQYGVQIYGAKITITKVEIIESN